MDKYQTIDGIYDLDECGIVGLTKILSKYDQSFNLPTSTISKIKFKYIKGHPLGRGKIMAFIDQKHFDTFDPMSRLGDLETIAFNEVVQYLRDLKIDQIL